MKKIILILLAIVGFVSCEISNSVEINSLNFKQTFIRINKGETRTILIDYLPSDATDVAIEYSTSDENIVSISGESKSGCVITGKIGGKAIITANCQGYTAYIEIEVIDSNLVLENHIIVPYVDITIERGLKKVIIASLYGGKENEGSLFKWESNNSCIELESLGNSCIIKALTPGIATVTVSHPSSKIDTSFIVIVPDSTSKLFYLTTKQNTVRVQSNTQNENIVKVITVGGTENDKANINFSIIEGQEYFSIVCLDGVCSINSKKAGYGRIMVTHKKAPQPLYIDVIITDTYDSAYFETDLNFVNINGLERKNINVFIKNCDDVNKYSTLTYRIEDESVINVVQNLNTFYITGKKDGKSKIFFKSDLCSYEHEILCVVQNTNLISLENYIKAPSIINMEVGQEDLELNIDLIGGTEADRNSFKWVVSDQNIIELYSADGNVEYNRSSNVLTSSISSKCYLNANNIGKAQIIVSHPKSENDYIISVNVHPKGTFSNTYANINYNKVIKGVVGESIEVNLKHNNDISLDNIKWEIEDANIGSINGNNLVGLLTLKGPGTTYLNIKSDNLKNDIRILVLSNLDESTENNYFYLEEKNIDIAKGKNIYLEIKEFGIINKENYKIVNSDNSICSAFIKDNVLIINGKNEGFAIIEIRNQDINNIVEYVYVNVINDEISIDYPYTIKVDKFFAAVSNETKDISLKLENAPIDEYENLNINILNKNVVEGYLLENKLHIKCKDPGETEIIIRHPKVFSEKRIKVKVFESEVEKNETVLISSEISNYILEEGDSISFNIEVNDESKIDNLIWEVSDSSILDVNVQGNSCLVNALNKGTASISIYYNSNYKYKINFSIKEKLNINEKYISLSPIIEILINESKIVSLNTQGFTTNELSLVEWELNGESIELNGSGKDVYLLGLAKGVSYIKAKINNYECYSTVICGETIEDIKSQNILAVEKNYYEVKKDNSIYISLSWGTFKPAEEVIQSIKWNNNNTDIIDIEYNGENCLIKAKEEGIATVLVNSESFINQLEIKIEVKGEIVNTFYNFNVKNIYKILKNDVQNISFDIFEKNGIKVEDYSDIQITKDNDNITYSIVDNLIRVSSDKIGKTTLTISSEKYKIETKILIIVYETEEELLNDFQILFEKDHYLIKKDSSINVSFLFESEFQECVENLTVRVGNNNVCSVEKVSLNVYKINGLNFGSSSIDFIYEDKIFNINVGVSNNTNDEVNITTESIINIKVGESYTTNIICEYDVSVNSYNSAIIDVKKLENNMFEIFGIAPGLVELIFESGTSERVVRVCIYEEDILNIINIDSREIRINKGDIFNIKPFTKNINLDYTKIKYEDLSKNNCIEISNNEGLLTIKGKEEGLSFIRVSYNDDYFDICVEVNNFHQDSVITNNNIFYLNYENPVLYINKDETEFLRSYVTGEGQYTYSEYNIWKVQDSSIIEADGTGDVLSVKGLKEGETYVTLQNSYCANSLTYKVIVGEKYINSNSKIPYIYVSENSVTMEYGGDNKIVQIELINIEGNIEDIKIENSVNNLIEYEKEFINEKLYLNIKPKLCGYGRLKFTHNKYDSYSCLDYIVKDNIDGSTIYLSTNDDYSFVKPGEYKNLKVSLENYEDFNSSNYKWNVEDESIVSIIGDGQNVSVFGKQEGITHINVTHPKSSNTLKLTVHVNKSLQIYKYIKADSNIIETKVSNILDSFRVYTIGGNGTEKYKYTVSDPSILSIIGNNDSCYFRGLKSGTCQIKIECISELNVMPFVVNIIVDEDKSGGAFLKCDSVVNYLEPFGATKTLNVNFNNVDNYDESLLEWQIYSQDISVYAEGGNVIEIVYSGSRAVVTPKNEGIAKIRVSYSPLNIKLNIIVYVSSVGTINFAEDSISLLENEVGFAEIEVPTFTSNMSGYITYTVENPSICKVNGTGSVCCIQGLKSGNTIVKAINSYDGSYDEIVVEVQKEDEDSNVRLFLNQTAILLNPRSESKNLIATLSGSSINIGDEDNINWSVSGNNESVKIYPTKGKEVKLYLEAVNGKIQEGSNYSSIITVKFKKENREVKKNIYVQVKEIDNYFTIDKSSIKIDTSTSDTITANIIGGTTQDYNNIIWSIPTIKINDDGTTTEIVRLLNTSGQKCQIYSVNGGLTEVHAFYNGEIRVCNINVIPNKVFSLVNNYITLYPGQKYDLHYTLRPSTSIPTWYSTDDGVNEKIINRTYSQSEQKLIIEGVNEGYTTLTGFVNGIGTVSCNIEVKYDPILRDLEETKTFDYMLYPESSEEYKKEKNTLEIEFLCYPEVYYIKAEFEGGFKTYKDHYTYELIQNQQPQQLVGKESGKCKLKIKFDGEISRSKVILRQYKDKECTDATGKELEYTIEAMYANRENPIKVYFKRNDGFFTLEGVDYNNYCNQLYNLNNVKSINWGDGESHYIILKPKYKNMILGNIDLGLNNTEGFLRKLNNGPIIDGENYVYSLKHDSDSGFNSFYNKKNSKFEESHKICEKCFYTRYAVKDVIWKNTYTIDNTKYTKYCKAYQPIKFKYTANAKVETVTDKITNSTELGYSIKYSDKNTFHVFNQFNFNSSDDCDQVNSNCHQSHITINNVFTIYSSCYNWYFKNNFNSLFYENKNNSNSLYLYEIYSQNSKHPIGFYDWVEHEHYERAANKVYGTFTSKVLDDYKIYNKKSDFPWVIDIKSKDKCPDIEIDLWRDKDIIENGAAIHLPSDATNTTTYKDMVSIEIEVNKSLIHKIDVSLIIRNCYRNLYSYDKNGIKDKSGDVIADDNFKSLIQDSYDCGCQ